MDTCSNCQKPLDNCKLGEHETEKRDNGDLVVFANALCGYCNHTIGSVVIDVVAVRPIDSADAGPCL